MQLALRPYITAGVAIVGASVIAVTPIAPPPVAASATNVSYASVALTSVANPIDRYGQVVTNTVTNISGLANYWMADPAPVASQVVANLATWGQQLGTGLQDAAPLLQYWATVTLPAAFAQAAGELQAGNIAQAARTITDTRHALVWAAFPLMSMVYVPGLIAGQFATAVQYVVGVATANTLVQLALGIPSTVLNTLADTAQAVLDSVKAGDLVSAAFAIANAPADIFDNVMNTRNTGLISKYTWGSCGCRDAGGPLFNLFFKLPRTVAEVIALPTATAATTSAPLAITEASTPEPAETVTSTPDASTIAYTDATEDTTDTAQTTTVATEDEATAGSTETDTAAADPETAPEVDAPPDSGTSNGATDLSNGNKVTPGQTHSNTKESDSDDAGRSGFLAADESDPPNPDSDTAAGGSSSNDDTSSTDADGDDSGSDAGGSTDGPDGGSDS